MKKYQVLLEGNNFLFDIEGKIEKYGFMVTRYVEALNPEKAEEKAVNLLKKDDSLIQRVLNDKLDAPMIYLDEIIELDSFENIETLETGYSFFPDECTKNIIKPRSQ